MAVRLNSRFATADETADVLSLSSKRAKELRKLIGASNGARRSKVNGKSLEGDAAERAQKNSSLETGSVRTGSLKSRSLRRTQRRGKETNASR
jgi:hypothetical protein